MVSLVHRGHSVWGQHHGHTLGGDKLPPWVSTTGVNHAVDTDRRYSIILSKTKAKQRLLAQKI